MASSDLKSVVRDKYAQVARTDGAACCGCDDINMIGDAYDGVAGHVAEADLGLGCGLPVEHAGLVRGQTVLDLGSGAGNDAFVARHHVGAGGRVIGLDFTPEMVHKARENAARLGYDNVEFIDGDIEAVPLPDASVDVVISNCVLNLVPDKVRAFAEMWRVLRPGGHFCISDIVSEGDLPAELLRVAELYAGCVSGAMERGTYLALLQRAGFTGVRIVKARAIDIPELVATSLSPEARERLAQGGVTSVTVVGRRP
jgi:arsenite methyltransferase